MDDTIPAHGGQLRALAAKFGVAEDSLLDFSASISPYAPGDELIDSLCKTMRARQALICYPDTNYSVLKDAITRYTGVKATSICVGNGGMSLFAAALRALRSRRCLVLTPAFLEYERVLAACSVEYCALALCEERGFAIDAERVIDRLKIVGADVLLLANPHSPSGRLYTTTELRKLQGRASHLGVDAIVDEAFIDYAPDESLWCEATVSPRLVVLRSLTKFFAMPGLRVGYAVAHPEIRAKLDAAMPLWPVDSIAAEAACLALKNSAWIEEIRENNRRERSWLTEQLRALCLTVFPAAANYLLFKIGEDVDGMELWRKLIMEHGIVVRSCANFQGLGPRHFRVGVRTRSENERLIAALSDYLPVL
jgi:threonine-phosphate decarboxylase